MSDSEPPSEPATPRRGRRKALKIVLFSTAGLLAVCTAGAAYLYEHLNHNIRTLPLYATSSPGHSLGPGMGLGTERPDASGRTPVNILMIGSDTRATAEDCRIGGDCGPGGANADVEMLVHLSADRSNASVMSIPRDTVMQLPACTDPRGTASTPGYYGQINATLQYGPACTVAAVHQLTAIPMDHFAMVDFSGVVAMSDAVGGVSVCVDDNLYDPYSGLKLAKGTHTLVGLSALQFLRTRHGFGDGSDLGRTYAQHVFLTQMVHKLKTAGTLTDPAALWKLADAGTKALTVDPGLGSITDLVALADDLAKVPAERLTFTTVQTDPDPQNQDRVVVAPAAQSLFDAITNDQSLATLARTSSPSATATAAALSGDGTVQVQYADALTDRAASIESTLLHEGYRTRSSSARTPVTRTTLTYAAGERDQAQRIAALLGLPAASLSTGDSPQLTLTIGPDWVQAAPLLSSSTGAPTPTDTGSALLDSHAQAGNQLGSCAAVGHQLTVQLNGTDLTPVQAYAVSTDIQDSAP